MWEYSVGVSSACVRTEAREKKMCQLQLRFAGKSSREGKNRVRVRCQCPEFKNGLGTFFFKKNTLREKGCIGCGLPVSL